jgi:hypothetical protein
LNDKLHTDPEFYGDIDFGCINFTDEMIWHWFGVM